MKALLSLALLSLLCGAQSVSISNDRFAELPQPRTEPIHRISFEGYDATPKFWARQHPGPRSYGCKLPAAARRQLQDQ